MTLLCSIAGHAAQATHRHNRGMDFSMCHHCGCDLIRTALGDWTQVPKGMRVIWREPARFGEVPAYDWMETMGRAPRRAARNRRPAPRRDPRGHPLDGVAAMLGILANLGRLVGGDLPDDVRSRSLRARPVRLPGSIH